MPIGPGIYIDPGGAHFGASVSISEFRHCPISLFPQLTSMFLLRSKFNSYLIDIFQAPFQVQLKWDLK